MFQLLCYTLKICKIELLIPSQDDNSVKGKPDDGSTEFSNKMILKYGTYRHSRGEFAEIFYFPTPFPHKCVAITGSPDTYDHELNWSIIKRNNESFYMYMDNGGNYTFSWIAIGY